MVCIIHQCILYTVESIRVWSAMDYRWWCALDINVYYSQSITVYKLLLIQAKLIWNAREREIKLRSANSIFYNLTRQIWLYSILTIPCTIDSEWSCDQDRFDCILCRVNRIWIELWKWNYISLIRKWQFTLCCKSWRVWYWSLVSISLVNIRLSNERYRHSLL